MKIHIGWVAMAIAVLAAMGMQVDDRPLESWEYFLVEIEREVGPDQSVHRTFLGHSIQGIEIEIATRGSAEKDSIRVYDKKRVLDLDGLAGLEGWSRTEFGGWQWEWTGEGNFQRWVRIPWTEGHSEGTTLRSAASGLNDHAFKALGQAGWEVFQVDESDLHRTQRRSYHLRRRLN